MPRESFQGKIESLRQAVLGLGQDVRNAIDASVIALRRVDVAASEAVIAQHPDLIERRWAIEGQPIVAVAEQSPVASDCRQLVSFLAILSDLARIADHARGIGEIGRMMGADRRSQRIGFLPSMAEKGLAMLETRCSHSPKTMPRVRGTS